MGYLLPLFKVISLTFALLAIGTGAQAIFDPIGFSKSFGLDLGTTSNPSQNSKKDDSFSFKSNHQHAVAQSYIALMGIRQLATGLILLTFAYQGKWMEMATVLAIIGIVVAGTDGVYLARAGLQGKGIFHAIPGALISALACGVLLSDA